MTTIDLARREVMPMVQYAIDDRRVIVLDDVLDTQEHTSLANELATAPFTRTETDGPESAEVTTFVHELDLSLFKQSNLFHRIEQYRLSERVGIGQNAYRAYCNLTCYGDVTYPHYDGLPNGQDVTALYYVTEMWNREWGGETTFYDKKGEIALSVLPLPNRLLLFYGSIEHRVGVPVRDCLKPRLSIACKFHVVSDNKNV